MESVIAAALITTHATSHNTLSQWTQTARAEKVKRPSISSAGTTEDWQYFTSRWGDYVRATKLEGTDRVIQLLQCCDDQLSNDLTRNALMITLAIREENIAVARVILHNMRQDRDERLWSQVEGENERLQVHTTMPDLRSQLDYTEAMVKRPGGQRNSDVLTRRQESRHDVVASTWIR